MMGANQYQISAILVPFWYKTGHITPVFVATNQISHVIFLVISQDFKYGDMLLRLNAPSKK
jgi:hypothetical protein